VHLITGNRATGWAHDNQAYNSVVYNAFSEEMASFLRHPVGRHIHIDMSARYDIGSSLDLSKHRVEPNTY